MMAETDSAVDGALAVTGDSTNHPGSLPQQDVVAGGRAFGPILPTLQHDDSRDTAMPDVADGPTFATPLQPDRNGIIVPSGPLSTGRLTRSMSKRLGIDLTITTTPSRTPLFDRLQSASSKGSKRAKTTRLEDARDIIYPATYGLQEVVQDGPRDDGDDGEEDVDIGLALRKTRAGSIRSDIGQLRVPGRRSDRIKSRAATRPKAAPKGGVRKRTKKTPAQPQKRAPPRRSARLAKPLTEFHKYGELPDELKICVWEAAIEPRLVYLRNKVAPNPTYDVQTKRPSWFMVTAISVDVAKKNYQKRFVTEASNTSLAITSTRQDVNTDVDVIAIEPCCTGCRGMFCARHQFSQADRESVRFLAVQTDSPYLISSASPGWVTISTAWPKVETLYLMKTALKGQQKEDKALIRIKEEDREKALRQKFDDWKKKAGADSKLTNLEFVVVVDKETQPQNPNDRYKGVQERKTGLVEDILLG